MSRVNQILDLQLKREKRARIIKILSIATAIVFFGVVFSFAQFQNFERVKFSSELSGTINSVQSVSSSNKFEKQFVVDLDSGKQLIFSATPDQPFHANEDVIVVKQELESGQIKYQLKPAKKLSVSQ